MTVVVGGSGFIVSSLILMLEVQTKWYIPKLTDIGWHSELSYCYRHYTASTVTDRGSRVLESNRCIRFHALWSYWIFISQWSSVSKWIIDLVGELGLFDWECDSMLGGYLEGAGGSFRGERARFRLMVCMHPIWLVAFGHDVFFVYRGCSIRVVH